MVFVPFRSGGPGARGADGLGAVVLVHRELAAVRGDAERSLAGERLAGGDGGLVLGVDPAEHARDEVAAGDMPLADADADAGEGLRAEVLRDGLQPVVPAGGAGGAHADAAGREVHLVEDDHEIRDGDLVEAQDRGERLAAQVHERLRLHEQHGLPAKHAARHEAVEGPLCLP